MIIWARRGVQAVVCGRRDRCPIGLFARLGAVSCCYPAIALNAEGLTGHDQAMTGQTFSASDCQPESPGPARPAATDTAYITAKDTR